MSIKLRLPFNLLSAKDRELMLRQRAVVKPERRLGASWTSDKVARRQPVVMCESCWRRYKGWWKKAHYRADWQWPYTVDCDGCSTVGIHGTLFQPEESFYLALSPAHGRRPQP